MKKKKDIVFTASAATLAAALSLSACAPVADVYGPPPGYPEEMETTIESVEETTDETVEVTVEETTATTSEITEETVDETEEETEETTEVCGYPLESDMENSKEDKISAFDTIDDFGIVDEDSRTYTNKNMHIEFQYSKFNDYMDPYTIPLVEYNGLDVDFFCSNDSMSFWCYTILGTVENDGTITSEDVAKYLGATSVTEEEYGGYKFAKFAGTDDSYLYVMVDGDNVFGFVFNVSFEGDVDYMNEILDSVKSI